MGGKLRIGSIVIRRYEFEKMLAFWQAALGYVTREPAEDGWVILRDPAGHRPNVSLDRTPERRAGQRRWFHFDLYTEDQRGEAERLVARRG